MADNGDYCHHLSIFSFFHGCQKVIRKDSFCPRPHSHTRLSVFLFFSPFLLFYVSSFFSRSTVAVFMENDEVLSYDSELALLEKLSQSTYRPIYLSVLQVEYFSVSILALTYINNHINRFHGHQRSKSMVSKGKNKQNQ